MNLDTVERCRNRCKPHNWNGESMDRYIHAHLTDYLVLILWHNLRMRNHQYQVETRRIKPTPMGDKWHSCHDTVYWNGNDLEEGLTLFRILKEQWGKDVL